MSKGTKLRERTDRTWRVSVQVVLKDGVLDAQGRAVEQVLHDHGYAEVENLRVGKLITFTLRAPDRARAETAVRELAGQILANPLIEAFDFQVAGSRTRRS